MNAHTHKHLSTNILFCKWFFLLFSGHKAGRIRKDCQSLYQIISDQPTGISSHNQNEIKKYNK